MARFVYLRITPEAGTIKTGMFREVPIHAQLIELGFLNFVKGAGDGPLFYQLGKSGDARKSIGFTNQKLGKWVRTLGVSDEDVAPNHGWRHAVQERLSRRWD